MALGLVHISSGAILHCRKSRPPPPPFPLQPHFTLISELEALHILQSKREETAGKHRRPEEKGGAKTRQCVARPAVLRSGGSLRQPPYGQTLPVCGHIAGPYREEFLYTAYSHAIRPCLHSNQALPALLSGLTCTSIRPYPHLNQALSALQSGLICTSIRPYLHFYRALPARLSKTHLDIRQTPAASPAGASHPGTGANDC